MTLLPGARLGPYEIVTAIGAGGMGEVFRAVDTKLNRDVAIKVLPAAFADDPERLARFTREAQTLASLNHPNIATIHGLENVGAPLVGALDATTDARERAGTRPAPTGPTIALVMELVEGEDPSAHIARGPIPVAEALPIARQIAEALEAAHEQGIVHLDLKPANIRVRADGTVKVLDFGLAKAMDPAGASSSNPNLSHSPTLTHQGTMAGMTIGTAAYMSPEQAKGKAVDKRTGIWAFGVVLYEMLTGQRAFKGEDVSETLASVLKNKLSMDTLPSTTPPRLRRLIERCLDRDLKARLRDIGEARLKIARIEAGGPDSAESVPASAAAAVVPTWRRALPWVLAALGFGAAVASIALWAPWRTGPCLSRRGSMSPRRRWTIPRPSRFRRTADRSSTPRRATAVRVCGCGGSTP
jgi:eukaryotic-like serine/threonine-protein kinase